MTIGSAGSFSLPATLSYWPIAPKAASFPTLSKHVAGEIPWYQILLQPGVKLFRNDPNLDPMGYYTLLVCALAQKHYRIPDLKQNLLGSDTNPAQVSRLNIGQLERGEIDAMFLYLSAASDLSLPYLMLPDEINLGNPAMAPYYEGVQFTNNKGQTFRGKPISFSAAVLKNANNPHAAQHFIEFLLSPIGQQLVQAAHFLPSPVLVGGDKTSVPDKIQNSPTG